MLQQNDMPATVAGVTQHIAQAMSALFEAERASTEPDGKSCVRNSFASLSQTMALLQDARSQHEGVGKAIDTIAQTMSVLYPLTIAPSSPPRSRTVLYGGDAATASNPPTHAEKPSARRERSSTRPSNRAPSNRAPAASASQRPAAINTAPPVDETALQPVATRKGNFTVERRQLEVNIGATTESNFFVGFSGDVKEGGVFFATYECLAKGSAVRLLVTLPGNFEFQTDGHVQYVRDVDDFEVASSPGMGIRFEALEDEQRELVLRFIRKRAPLFFDS